MARDRKRAKQRRDRARRAGAGTAVRRPRRDEPRPVELDRPAELDRPTELDSPADPDRRADLDRPADPDRRADPERPADLDGPVGEDEDREAIEAPDPLDHASADVDLAEAQLAVGRPDEAGDEDDGEIYPDELEEDATGGGRGGGRELTRLGGAPRERGPHRPPRGINRMLAFLVASWHELQRVQWPDRRQVAQATGVVIAFVIIAGVYLGLADALFSRLVNAIL
jgi:preprotein translocase subunit SecE